MLPSNLLIKGPIEKAWGFAWPLFRDNRYELVRIEVAAGGHSSIHMHEWKDNLFLVERGTLRIRIFCQDQPEYHIDLTAGQSFLVEPCVRHEFEALSESVEAVELYCSKNGRVISPQDIVRFSEGGIRKPVAQTVA